MKIFKIVWTLAGLASAGVFTTGCYTRARVYEPAGAEVYSGYDYAPGYYTDGTTYYYERDTRNDYRSPRDDRRWELHRHYRNDNDWHHNDRDWDRH